MRTSGTPLAMPSSTLSGMMSGAKPLEHRRVEVTAGRRDRVPGRHEARAVDPAVVDRARERDVEQVAAGLHEQPEVAHGREARRAASCGSSACRAACGTRGRPGRRCACSRRCGPPRSMLSSMSMSPGSSVTSPRSISVAPLGHARSGSTAAMRSPSTTIDRRRRAPRPRRRRPSGPPAGRSHAVAHGLGSIEEVEVRGAASRGRAAGATPRPGTTP